ncbi:MAG: hypothetical protein AAGA12_14770 [Pseudomonadota bacterium]
MSQSRYAETRNNKRLLFWWLGLFCSYFLVIAITELIAIFQPESVFYAANLVFEHRLDWFWLNRGYDLGYMDYLGHSDLATDTYYLQIVAMFYASIFYVLWRVLIPIQGGRFLVKQALEHSATLEHIKFHGPGMFLLTAVGFSMLMYWGLFVATAGSNPDGRDFLFSAPPRAHVYFGIAAEILSLFFFTISSEGAFNAARYLIVEKFAPGKGR